MARFMRVIIFFDLPVETSVDRKAYRKFRKLLISSGFSMMQESVYTKLVLNPIAADTVMKQIDKEKPPKGLVQALIITEKQYSKIQNLVGEQKSDVITSQNRTVIL